MALRLRTVRAKLTALVGLTAIATLVAVGVLSWVTHRQLIGEIRGRVWAASRAFIVELEDELTDLEIAARSLATRDYSARALKERDTRRARRIAALFFQHHPEMVVALYDATGRLVAEHGVGKPARSTGALPELGGLPEFGYGGVVEHGCEDPAGEAPPAYMKALRVADTGVVVGCLPLAQSFLRKVRTKLRVELAVLEPDKGARRPTGLFPQGRLAEAGPRPDTVEADGRLWAFQRIEPKSLVGRKGQYAVVVALDVTRLRSILRQNQYLAFGFLIGTALVGLLFGARLAARMSSALARVANGFRKLATHDYAHVEPVRTGDEIEDLAHGFNDMVDGLRERDKLRSTLGKYMTQTVMEHLLAGKVQLGGETLPVTILFSDIRSFTTISEKMDAQAVVELLNRYFTRMVQILIEEDGVVDKYIGDAIMAVFGAPVPKPDDAVRAVRAAVRMRDALADLNRELVVAGFPELRAGIGVHSGRVVAGNIGSEARMEYTVIGDAVNLASRLESSTKELGVGILISEETYELAREVVDAEPLSAIHVKGRSQACRIYAVHGLRSSVAAAE
jgi:adenylate cyclase